MIKGLLTNREKAIQFVRNLPEEYFIRLICRTHGNINHEWIEVQPDGSVNEAEEPDNNATHWLKYPDKAVAGIFNIHVDSAEPCNCEICTMYRHFKEYSKEEFIERYDNYSWDYCDDVTLSEAIFAEDKSPSIEDVQVEMIENIKSIEYGYFDDEDMKE